MDLTQAPFQVGDRVRCINPYLGSPYRPGREGVITNITPSDSASQWIEIDNDPFIVLIPSDLELVERAS